MRRTPLAAPGAPALPVRRTRRACARESPAGPARPSEPTTGVAPERRAHATWPLPVDQETAVRCVRATRHGVTVARPDLKTIAMRKAGPARPKLHLDRAADCRKRVTTRLANGMITDH